MQKQNVVRGAVLHAQGVGLHVYLRTIGDIYAQMECGKRYLFRRLEPVQTVSPAIACDLCYQAYIANEITSGRDPFRTPEAQVSPHWKRPDRHLLRAVYVCHNLACPHKGIEFGSVDPYEALCRICGRRAIWKRGYQR